MEIEIDLFFAPFYCYIIAVFFFFHFYSLHINVVINVLRYWLSTELAPCRPFWHEYVIYIYTQLKYTIYPFQKSHINNWQTRNTFRIVCYLINSVFVLRSSCQLLEGCMAQRHVLLAKYLTTKYIWNGYEHIVRYIYLQTPPFGEQQPTINNNVKNVYNDDHLYSMQMCSNDSICIYISVLLYLSSLMADTQIHIKTCPIEYIYVYTNAHIIIIITFMFDVGVLIIIILMLRVYKNIYLCVCV